jgi:hypothetical protein
MNKRATVIRVGITAILIIVGVLTVAVPVWLRTPDAGYCWLVGWVIISVGGWMIPHRFTAGVVVGAACAMESIMLVMFLAKP